MVQFQKCQGLTGKVLLLAISRAWYASSNRSKKSRSYAAQETLSQAGAWPARKSRIFSLTTSAAVYSAT
jgi:hypothetical protein